MNRKLEKNRDSLELGWKVDLIPVSGKEETWIQIRALDASGKPLEGLNGKLNLYRPSNRLEDTTLRLSEKSPGFYEIRTPKLASGLWQFRLELKMESRECSKTTTADICPETRHPVVLNSSVLIFPGQAEFQAEFSRNILSSRIFPGVKFRPQKRQEACCFRSTRLTTPF